MLNNVPHLSDKALPQLPMQMELLRTISEKVPAHIVYWDRDLRCRYANRTAAEAFHKSETEIIGMHIKEILGEMIYDRDKSRLDGALLGETQEFEEPFQDKSGKIRYHHVQLVPDQKGDKTVGFFALVTDITKLIDTQRALQESQGLISAIIDSVGSCLVVLDATGNIVIVNRDWVDFAIQNSAPDHVTCGIGEDYFAVCERAMPNADIEHILRGLRGVSSGKLPYFSTEYDCHSPDEKRWFLMNAVPLMGGRKGMVITHTNITRQKLESEERLAWAVAQRDALVREVHHRIKNNLQSVGSLLRRELGTFPEFDSRLEHAIDQLHTISVVHGLQSQTTSEDIALTDTLQEICDRQRVQYGRSIKLNISYPNKNSCMAKVIHDEAVAIALIFNELVSNACKHSPVDTEISLSVEFLPNGHGIDVRISNTVANAVSEFNFDTEQNIGTGLRLIKALLPFQGATLHFKLMAPDLLVTELFLTGPVVAQ